MKTYFELSVHCNKLLEESICDLLFDCGALGTEIRDNIKVDNKYAWAIVESNYDIADENIEILGFFNDLNQQKFEEIKSKIIKLSNCFENAGKVFIDFKSKVEENWDTEWKKYYNPIVIGNFAVVPEWLDYENKDGKTKIFINPNMAFGTGQHETTKMCLELLSKVDIKDKKIVDVGTGSGILAIAAIKGGASFALMLDTDSLALKSARNNIEINNVNDSVRTECRGIENGDSGDIVIANITANVLLSIKKELISAVKKGGKLILSGIISGREKEIEDAFTEKLNLVDKAEMGEWKAFLFERL